MEQHTKGERESNERQVELNQVSLLNMFQSK